MVQEDKFKYSKSVIQLPFFFIFAIWAIYWIEIKFGLNFTEYGVYPRSFKGLRGIILAPFIHSGISHLFNNSIPILVLLSSLLYFYREIFWRVMVYGWICSGFLTWFIVRPSYHIGASGIIYLLFSFIFFSGIIRKYYRLIAVSLIVIFLYGSMVWYVFPIKEGMSWEGHLSGFIVGLLLAIIFRKVGPQKARYYFKETAFDLLFDEHGNFVPPEESEENEQIEEEGSGSKESENQKIDSEKFKDSLD